MNAQQALDWLKSNFLIVIFAILILGVFVVLPILSSGMQKSVDEIKDDRERLDQQLTQLSQTPIELRDPTLGARPIEQKTALINPAALREFAQYTDARERKADAIVDAATTFNRKNRRVLVAGLFPDPARIDEAALLLEFTSRLRAAYEGLLGEITAGEPPTLADMKEALVRQERQFKNSIESREGPGDLTDEEMHELRTLLSGRRFGLATQAAKNFGIYASLDTIAPPSWSEGQDAPTSIERYRWQWDYWVIEDIFYAIKTANNGSTEILNSPVKRIVAIDVSDTGIESENGSAWNRSSRGDRTPGAPPGDGPFLAGGGSGAGMGGGGDSDAQGRGRGSGSQNQEPEDEEPTGKSADPSAEVKPDFAHSMTGRTTNPLYDLRYVKLHLVVETARIPEMLDAIGRQNLMTIVGLELWPADPFLDLESGYVYGNQPTSEIVLDIETVWLRAWTTQFMPLNVKVALEIPVEGNTKTNSSNP